MMKPYQAYSGLIATEIHKRVSFAVPARANKQNCCSVRTSKVDTKKLIWHDTSVGTVIFPVYRAGRTGFV